MNRPIYHRAIIFLFLVFCGVAVASAKQAYVTNLVADKTSLSGGNSLTLTVDISSPAGPNGLDVPINSSHPGTIPNLVCHFFPQESTHRISLIPNPVTTATSVKLVARTGSAEREVAVKMVPPGLASVRSSASGVVSGTRFFLFTLLDGWATPGGITVALTSSDPGVIAVPSTVLIPAGLSYHIEIPRAGHVGQATVVTVTATYKGVSRSVSVTVFP